MNLSQTTIFTTFRGFFFVFLFCISNSCSSNQNLTNTVNFPVKPLIIPGDNGDDFGDGDFTISITNISESDSGKRYTAVSSYKNEELGLLIFVPNSQGGNKGFGGGIILKSLGKRSDRLLVLLAQLYKQILPANSTFVKSISLEYVDLKEFGKTLTGNTSDQKSTMEYKLFLKNKDKDAELYLNIKPEELLIEIHEKDEEYRSTIIQILSTR